MPCRPLALKEALLVAFAFAFIAFAFVPASLPAPCRLLSLQDASGLFALLAESLPMGPPEAEGGGSADAPADLMASTRPRVEEGLQVTQKIFGESQKALQALSGMPQSPMVATCREQLEAAMQAVLQCLQSLQELNTFGRIGGEAAGPESCKTLLRSCAAKVLHLQQACQMCKALKPVD